MTFTADQLTRLRDNLDGLGYPMGPRGLFGIGNEQNAFDATALGGGSITANNSMRSIKVLDAYTRSAIYQFQRDRQLTADGKFSADLLTQVDGIVRNLQNNLKLVLKKNDLPLTGYYGIQTFQGVKEYQKAKGLPITGIATSAIQRQLNDEARKLAGKPTTGGSTTPPVVAPNDAVTKLAALSSIKRRYQNGDILTDDFVKEVIQAIP